MSSNGKGHLIRPDEDASATFSVSSDAQPGDVYQVRYGQNNNYATTTFIVGEPAPQGSYEVYFYTLIPGVGWDSTAAPNNKWNGMGVGWVKGLGDPEDYPNNGVDLSGDASEVSFPSTYPDIEVDGVTYTYAAPGSGYENTRGYYTIEWVRLVKADGANSGANDYNPEVPGVSDGGRSTFHYDGQVNINETDKYNVAFRIQMPGSDEFTIQLDYSRIVESGTQENRLRRPDQAHDFDETIVQDGVTYKFDGWYTNEECTQEADFSGTITSNKNYYAKYVPQNLPGTTIRVQVIKDGQQVDAADYLDNIDNWNNGTQDFKLGKDGNVYTVDYTYSNLNCADFTFDIKNVDSYEVTVQSNPDDPTTGLDGTIREVAILESTPGTWTLDNIPAGAMVTVTLRSSVTIDYSWSGIEGTQPEFSEPDGDTVNYGDTWTTDTTYTSESTFDNEYGTWTFSGWEAEPTFTATEDKTITGTWSLTSIRIDGPAVEVSGPEDVYYNGSTQKLMPTVTDAGGNPIDPEHYTVSWSDDTVNAGEVTITVSGQNGYSGETSVTYRILPIELTITTDSAAKIYDGLELTAPGRIEGLVEGDATFTVNGSQTEVGKSENAYTLIFSAGKRGNYSQINTNIGTLTVTPQTINPDDPDNPGSYGEVEVSYPQDVPYNGTNQTWVPTVTDGNKVLVAGTDYEVSYSTDDHTNVTGTIRVTITGKGNYTGSVERYYQITPLTITVTPRDIRKTQGQADPTLTSDYSGYLRGETAGWTGALTREPGEAVGTYTISKGSLQLADNPAGNFLAQNYILVVNEGTFTIVAAPVTPGGGDTPTPTPGGGGDGTPTPGTPATVTPADDTTTDEAAPEETIADDENALAAPTDTIGDDDTPLAAGAKDEDCWVHWLILLGMILSAVYFVGVGVRRRKFTSSLLGYEDKVLGNDRDNA